MWSLVGGQDFRFGSDQYVVRCVCVVEVFDDQKIVGNGGGAIVG